MTERDYDCPHCSRGGFSGPEGLKRHFTVQHASNVNTSGKYSEEVLDLVPEPEPWGVEKTSTCANCGAEFTRRVAKETEPKYCSNECVGLSSTDTDPRAPRGDARERALQRDNWNCQRCGSSVGEGQEHDPEVHHLFPKMAGGTDHPQNLITLCKKCHQRVHNDMKQLAQERPDVLDELREVVQRGV